MTRAEQLNNIKTGILESTSSFEKIKFIKVKYKKIDFHNERLDLIEDDFGISDFSLFFYSSRISNENEKFKKLNAFNNIVGGIKVKIEYHQKQSDTLHNPLIIEKLWISLSGEDSYTRFVDFDYFYNHFLLHIDVNKLNSLINPIYSDILKLNKELSRKRQLEDHEDKSYENNEHYDQSLDLDQQSPEFWDEI